MPLQLGGIETARSRVVVWDPAVMVQANDARATMDKLLKQGFRLRSTDEGEAILDPPPKPENINVFRVLSQNGDDRIIWDRTNPQQVKEAFATFKGFMAKGYSAYAVLANGKRGHKITEFDPGLQEILCAKGTEVVLVPATCPG